MVGPNSPSDHKSDETVYSLVELGLLFCPEERLRELGQVAQPHSYYMGKIALESSSIQFQNMYFSLTVLFLWNSVSSSLK